MKKFEAPEIEVLEIVDVITDNQLSQGYEPDEF